MNTRRGLWLQSRHPLLLALIALLWLLMQQQLLTHTISHTNGGTHSSAPDKKLPGETGGERGCERCLSLSPLGASIGGGKPPVFTLVASHESAPSLRVADPLRPFLRAFDSQAPPASSATI